jgi:hypothetical protein
MYIQDFFHTLSNDLSPLRNSYMMKPYVLYSLFTAMIHLKNGIPNGQQMLDCNPVGRYYSDHKKAVAKLLELADAHETQDITGPHSEYVIACLSTTTKISQRKARTKAIINALSG